ncbi:MAG: hypothetical protein ACE5LU_23400, partial [Anaerolineae bacterium]
GAIIGIDLLNPLASVIIFQYNPKSLTRKLDAQTAGEDAARSEVLRLSGPPKETITINKLEIDATDQLEQAQATAVSMGIYPQLSALEMLLYPKSSLVIANTVLLAVGTIEVVPPEAPFTLFVWGAKRVLPVRITGFTITEQEYDPNLNPIRATVNLSMRVLTYNDFPVTHPGYALFLAHQVIKETMAVVGSVSNVGAVAGGNISLL